MLVLLFRDKNLFRNLLRSRENMASGWCLRALVFCWSINVLYSKYTPDWKSIDSRPLPAWYDEVKFGIFMHWGVFSVPSYQSEWFWWDWQGAKDPAVIEFMQANYRPDFTYPDFAKHFTNEFFDPFEWADVLASSGAKYVVLTSKHHEGFCNWNTATSQGWNSVDVNPFQDLVGELATAIRNRTDIHFGLYFSQFEWFNRWYLADKKNKFKTQIYPEMVSLAQMYELVNKYQPEVIWSDGDWEASSSYWNSTEFLAWLYNDSPVKETVVVNDRWGSECACKHGGYWTCQDRYNPHKLVNHKWENAMTIQKTSWGYIRNTDINGYLNTSEIINELVTTVACGGNLLMNFGPTHDGRIMPIFRERLKETGTWLKTNGEAIYGSSPWSHQNDTVSSYVWYTTNKTTTAVYAHVLQWPSNYMVILGALSGVKPESVSLLGYSKSLDFSATSDGLIVVLPYLPLNTTLKWAWVLKIEGVPPPKEQPWVNLLKSKGL